MAVNKNFVVKNGLEIANDLIFASAVLRNVGIGSTIPSVALDVRGGVAATDIYSTGVGTFSTLAVTGTGTANNFIVTGVTTLGSAGGITTTGGDFYVGGDLYIKDDLTFDEFTARNANVTGIGTIVNFVSTNATITDINATGVSTLAGLNATNVATLANANITGVTTVANLTLTNGQVSGALTVSSEEIYFPFSVSGIGTTIFQYAAGIGFTVAGDNPTIFVLRGEHYRFSVNDADSPFYIKTTAGVGTNTDLYTDGVIGNGTTVGIVTWKVPFNSPNELFYCSSVNVDQKGTIKVGGGGGGGGSLGIQSEGTNVGAAQTLNFVGGGATFAVVGDGTIDVTITRQEVTPTTRRTVSFSSTEGQVSYATTYNVNTGVDVFLNGSYLSTDQYTASNGTSVVLGDAAAIGDIVDIVVLNLGDSLQGNVGVQGSVGIGSTGPQGIQGIQGTSGSAVAQGTQGIQGLTGTAAISIADDTSTDASMYILFNTASSGSATTVKASSSKLTYNPSSGQVAAVDFNSTSDINLKENIQNLDNSIDTLNAINPVKFDWKETGETSYGVIAQELEGVLPELVKQQGDHKSVSYMPLIAFLIDAVKTQQGEIEALKDSVSGIS